MVHLNVALQVFSTFKLDTTLRTPQTATRSLIHLLWGQAQRLSIGAPGHAPSTQAVGKAVHIQFYQVLLISELFQAQRALVEFLQGLAIGRRGCRVSCQFLHVKRPVNFQLKRRGDCLHADNAAKPGEGVSEVGMHLAVFDKLLLALQRHFADPTRSRIQTLAVGDLVLGQSQERWEALAADGAHVVLRWAPVGLHVLSQAIF